MYNRDLVDHLNDRTLADKSTGRAHLTAFYVLSNQQGKGYGSLAIRAVERTARQPEHGIKVLTLHTVLLFTLVFIITCTNVKSQVVAFGICRSYFLGEVARTKGGSTPA